MYISNPMEKETKPKSTRELTLPLSKIKMIMKSSPDVVNINRESVCLIAKATELFVQHLALLALRNSNDAYMVEYNDLAEVINERTTMEFLQDIIPRKMKAKDYFDMMNEAETNEEEFDLLSMLHQDELSQQTKK